MSGGEDSARPILVTGSTGQVGFELVRRLSALGNVVAPPRAELNLADGAAIRDAVRSLRPRIIVNAAAYTAVDRAESDAEMAATINVDAPAILASEARLLGAAMVHYSTDYVFDGEKSGAYVEGDRTNPLSVYGKTKLGGEDAVRDAGGAWMVLRTSWVYALRGSNFLRTMLRLRADQPELRVVSDQYGSPTWAADVADATLRILSSGTLSGSTAEFLEERAGVYHLSAAGSTTWFGFANAIFGRAGEPAPKVLPIPTTDYPTPARRPRNSVLDNSKVASAFAITIPNWEARLGVAMASEGSWE